MNLADDDFLYQVTMRICGSLDVETMLRDCLEFFKDIKIIPADGLGMQVYDLAEGVLEDFAVVADMDYDISKINLQLSPEAIAYFKKMEKGEFVESDFIVNRPQDNPVARFAWEASGKKPISYMFSLLKIGRERVGIVTVYAKGYDSFTEQDLKILDRLRGPFSVALSNALQFMEVQRLKEMLADDNRYLNKQIYNMSGDEIIGQDFGLREVIEMVGQVALLSSQVLLLGETGVGKEVIANAIHHLSPKASGPFIKVNCGAIPEALIDSELFGHEKGAFTGAIQKKRGRFERAHGGTIFLDEIGELPLEAQIRLLRVIQTREIERVGGTESVALDIRIIAATHRDLPSMVRESTFREDLWFRLNVFPITIPPLRHRLVDIPALVNFFIKRKTREMNLYPERKPAPGSFEMLQGYNWPGNVRELENVVERALIRSTTSPQGTFLRFDEINFPQEHSSTAIPVDRVEAPPVLNMDQAMKHHIESVLQLTKGKLSGKDGAAVLLGLPLSTLRNRMIKLGLLSHKKGNEKGSVTRH